MFRNERREKTEIRKIKVTKKIREERAAQIAKELNRTERWHTHGHGISMDVLRKDRRLKLKIDDFGQDQELPSMQQRDLL